MNLDTSTISKAIAGGLITLLVSFVARYGFTLSPLVHDALASIAFALVSYLIGHVAVYLAPKNK